MTSTNHEGTPKPRMAENADEPGQYELVTRVAAQVVDPGGVLFAQQFISGYGNIRQCKILFLGTHDVIESGVVRVGFKLAKDKTMRFGGDEWKFDREQTGAPTFHFIARGIKQEQWEEATIFIDGAKTDYPVPVISTEGVDGDNNPPISHQYFIREDAIPGRYEISSVMTYFNGEIWKTSTSSIHFTVRSRLEKYEKRIMWVGGIASALAIYRFGLLPLFQLIF